MTQVSKQGGQVSSLQKFKGLLGQEGIRKKFDEALGKKAPLFVSNLVTIMSGSAELQKCEHMSIVSSALMAASMDLPLTPGLGFAGIVPYWDSQSGQMKAQFQVMKKGFIQLAQRTGLFKIINVSPVCEGELKKRNKFTGEYEFDEDCKISDRIMGYVSYFKLVNGFEKYLYMPIEELDKHANRYSKSFQKGKGKWADKDGGGYEQMCEKTVLKLNLSTYAPLSVDTNMMNAVIYDQAEIRDAEGKDFDYMDNEESTKPTEKEVFENTDTGATHVIDKGSSARSAELTNKTSQTIDKKLGAAPPVVDPIVEDVEEMPDPSSQALESNFESQAAVQGDGVTTPIKVETEPKKVYTEEELIDMETNKLLAMIKLNADMNRACAANPKANTNKKLRTIILMYQAGKIEDYINMYSSDKEPKQINAPEAGQPAPEHMEVPAEVTPEEDLPQVLQDDSTQQEENSSTQEEQAGSSDNKFNIVVTELGEEGRRDETEAEVLFDALGYVAKLTNALYRTLQDDKKELDPYSNKEAFCFSAPAELINNILNELE